MSFLISKLFYTIVFHSFLFLFLIIGIQNSSNKSKVNFLLDETVELPVSFILGLSFISGSILGSTMRIDFNKNIK